MIYNTKCKIGDKIDTDVKKGKLLASQQNIIDFNIKRKIGDKLI